MVRDLRRFKVYDVQLEVLNEGFMELVESRGTMKSKW